MHIHVDQNELDLNQRQTYKGSWDGGDVQFIMAARLQISRAIMMSPMSKVQTPQVVVIVALVEKNPIRRRP